MASHAPPPRSRAGAAAVGAVFGAALVLAAGTALTVTGAGLRVAVPARFLYRCDGDARPGASTAAAAPPVAAPAARGGSAAEGDGGRGNARLGAPSGAPATDAPPPGQLPAACSDYARWRPHLESQLRWWRPGSVSQGDVAAAYERDDFNVVARVQVIGNRMRWRKRTKGLHYMTRPPDVAQSLLHALTRFADVPWPDFDLAYTTLDDPQQPQDVTERERMAPAPIASMSYTSIHLDLPVPDFVFWSWMDAGDAEERTWHYDRTIDAILNSSSHAARPFEARLPRALFRGSLQHSRDRGQLLEETKLHESLFDIASTKDSPVGLRNFSRWQVQLCIAGNGYCARMKYLLATGSPVVALMGSDRGRMHEWFYPEMRPWVHYVPVRNARDAVAAVRHLLEHPAEAAAIGAAGQAFARAVLRRDGLDCYWLYFAHAYSRILAHPLAPDAAAVPIAAPRDLEAAYLDNAYWDALPPASS